MIKAKKVYRKEDLDKQSSANTELAPKGESKYNIWLYKGCLLYTSPSPRDRTRSRMPSSA